jgi:hypothetical protein
VTDWLASSISADDSRAIAVGKSAGVVTARELSCETAMRLLANVVDVGFADDPAHTADELARLPVCRVITAIGSDYADAAVLETSDGALLIDGVTREAVEAFQQKRRKSPGMRLGEKRHAPRTTFDGSRSTDCLIGMNGDDVEIECGGSSTTDALLISDRRFRLSIRREACVYCRSHRVCPFLASSSLPGDDNVRRSDDSSKLRHFFEANRCYGTGCALKAPGAR